MIPVLLFISAASAAKLDAPTPYDPVWLASVQEFPQATNTNESRLWGWVYETDVEFRLFTRNNPFEYQVININDSASLHNSLFNFNNKVKLLTHGWLNHGSSPMPESIKEAYLNVSDINIIVVDWGIAANVNYILASYNVAMVGMILTQFLNFLIEEGVSMDDMHLIGHSLGAHVVGIAGAFVKKGPIDTITGLDPAFPLFTYGNKDARLDKHDARHVEVIHTCGGYLGFRSPLGHIDFYPNGGTRQPGCGYDIRVVFSSVLLLAGYTLTEDTLASGHIDFYPNGGTRQPGCGRIFLPPALRPPSLNYFLPSFLFTYGNKDARLDKHDARHVEVIHTCGGYLGFRSPLGHIDFYPNGGTRQPGCGYDIRVLEADGIKVKEERSLNLWPFVGMGLRLTEDDVDHGLTMIGIFLFKNSRVLS
ncbi:lipase domain-containing protein [Phthorimaea operculella]|nr:lipase domain-containing protein [Phthorimaea operculella]